MYSDEWGFTGRLARECASQKMDEAVRARPEAWMAVNAICNGMKCCQSYLGTENGGLASGGPDIVETIRQTVGNLFGAATHFRITGSIATGPRGVQTFGSDHEVTPEDAPAATGQELRILSHGVSATSGHSLETDSGSGYVGATEGNCRHGHRQISISVRSCGSAILYDFAAAYHRSTIARDHILQALVPLYRGQLFSFLVDHAQSTPEEMEADTEALCLEFERQKPYLIERWKAKS